MADLNFRNRTLFHGDNLDFLRGMDSETDSTTFRIACYSAARVIEPSRNMLTLSGLRKLNRQKGWMAKA